jgi:hypothetical protein
VYLLSSSWQGWKKSDSDLEMTAVSLAFAPKRQNFCFCHLHPVENLWKKKFNFYLIIVM